MSINVRARVVGVRPRDDDTFGVTLGPGPKIFWFRTNDPPQLGDLVVIHGAEATRMSIGTSGHTVTMLEGGSLETIPDPFPRRVVDPMWVKRAHEIVKRPLMSYQAEGAGWMASRLAARKGCILGDEPGLGKTTQVLATIAACRLTPTIIVCPPGVKRNWPREVQFLKPLFKVAVINKSYGPLPRAHIYIINYDILRSREEQLKKLKARLLIFDEAHLLKEPTPSYNHRAAVATRLAHSIGRVIHLTGTPLLNKPQDLWRLLHILDPHVWRSFQDYRERYCTVPDDTEKNLPSIVTSHGQAKRLSELRALIAPYMLRRRSSQVLTLSAKQRIRLTVKLEKFDRENYDAAEKNVIAWARAHGNMRLSNGSERGKALVKLNMLRRIAAVGKLRKAVPEFLDAFFEENPSSPLVIFAYHRVVRTGLIEVCKRKGLKIASIAGTDNDQKRQEAVDKFQNGHADVFIAPLKSAGVGINLQRASDILCLERLWTPSLNNQAEDRCHRIGQKNRVRIRYLDAVDTVDEHIADVVDAKQRLIDRVVDDIEVSDDRDTVETIEEVLARVTRARRDRGAA